MASLRNALLRNVGRVVLAAIVPASALLIGALHTTVLVVLTIAAAVAAVMLWLEPPRRMSRASRWVLFAMLTLVVATALQSLPLPAAVASALSPRAAEIWDRCLSPMREIGPGWHPLSVAPAATHVDLLRGVFYACVFVAALRIALSDGGTWFLECVVIGSACVLALATLAHNAVDAQTVFGIYHPRDVQGYAPSRIGPLLNANHVAAYANVGAMVAAGVALRERAAVLRIVGGAAAVLLAGTSVWVASRGGTASLVAGLVLIGLLSVGRRSSGRRASTVEALVVLGALISAGVLVAFGTSDVTRQDLAGRDLSKLGIIKTALRLVSLSPIFGGGRGSFETTFPAVREGGSYYTFLRPENIVAQWVIEWGIPVAVAAFALFALALNPRTPLRSKKATFGAWVAVVVVLLHDLVDFHLEVPGIAALAVLCVAIIVGRGALDIDGSKPASPRMGRIVAFALAPCALLAAAIVVPDIGHTVAEDRDAIAQMAVDRTLSSDEFRSNVRAMMMRYPAEPFFPLAGAIRAQMVNDDAVIAWIARALERYPTFGRAHLVLARSLSARHAAQARLEYRLAYAYDEQLHAAVEREVPLLIGDRATAREVAPDGPAGIDMLEKLVTALSPRLPATALRLDDDLTERDPHAAGPLRRRVSAAISDLTHQHPWCADKDACSRDALRGAQELVERDPDKCEPRTLLASVRIASGHVREGLDGLEAALEKTTERGPCIRELVRASLENGDRRRADTAIDQATRLGCGTRAECVDLYTWVANLEASRGNSVRAIAFYKRAADLVPEDDTYLARVAALSESTGWTSEAIDAYRKLGMRHPDNATYAAKVRELETKATEGRMAAPR